MSCARSLESVRIAVDFVRPSVIKRMNKKNGSGTMSGRQSIKCIDAYKRRCAVVALALCVPAVPSVAHAGSINANTATYAGDVSGLNFPVGTVAASNYTAFRHGDAYYDSNDDADRSGNLGVMINVMRVDWIVATIYHMPFVLCLTDIWTMPRSTART